MRNLSSATQIYKGHVGAVMSVDWAPTGQGLVTGSYDRTVRLWDVGKGARSRDVYHTKRMQKVFSVAYTLDARFVLSGSDDGNVRLWKHSASDKLGIVSARERASREYAQALRRRWNSVGDVAKIERQRHVPKPIRSAQKLQHTMLEARRVKEERRRKHTKVRTLLLTVRVVPRNPKLPENRWCSKKKSSCQSQLYDLVERAPRRNVWRWWGRRPSIGQARSVSMAEVGADVRPSSRLRRRHCGGDGAPCDLGAVTFIASVCPL